MSGEAAVAVLSNTMYSVRLFDSSRANGNFHMDTYIMWKILTVPDNEIGYGTYKVTLLLEPSGSEEASLVSVCPSS